MQKKWTTISAEEFVYIVKPNDTLGKISKTIYKTPGMWKKLAEYNNIENPSKIFPGDIIKYRADETSKSYAASHSVPEAYSVKERRHSVFYFSRNLRQRQLLEGFIQMEPRIDQKSRFNHA